MALFESLPIMEGSDLLFPAPEGGELSDSAFGALIQLRDIRRTCETMLAALKVSKDVRSHLLSHGLGGVQNQHYDRHSYWLEKVQALRKWAAHLAKLKAGTTVNRVPLARRQEPGQQRP